MTDAAIDSGYQPVNLLRASFKQWTIACDPLLARNPLWYWVIAILSPLFYFPFYICGIFAFLFEREWIRDPAIIWWVVALKLLAVRLIANVKVLCVCVCVRACVRACVYVCVFGCHLGGRCCPARLSLSSLRSCGAITRAPIDCKCSAAICPM